MAITVNDKDLGMVTAYAYALAGGYTGTEAEFEALLGKIAEDLAEIENLSVQVQTLPAGSDATASYAEGVLTLGIPRGDKGETGDQGEIGPTPQLSVGAVTTGAPGTDAEVEITGTPEAPILNFTIPRGDTGNITQAVRYDAAQTLTDAEKEQARANIDAADAGEVADLKSAMIEKIDSRAVPYGYEKYKNDPSIWEKGYIDSSTGTNGSSTSTIGRIRIRTKEYITDVDAIIRIDGGKNIRVLRYQLDGTYIDAIDSVSEYSTFDYSEYKYRLSVSRPTDGSVEDGLALYVLLAKKSDLASETELNEVTGEIRNILSLDGDTTIPFTIAETGRCIRFSTGNTDANSTTNTTDYVDISLFAELFYKRIQSASASPTYGLAFYDSNKIYISGERCQPNADSFAYVSDLKQIKIPANAKYVRFTIIADTETYGNFEVYGKSKIQYRLDYYKSDYNKNVIFGSFSTDWYAGQGNSYEGFTINTLYAEIISAWDALMSRSGGYISRESIGESADGQTMYCYKLIPTRYRNNTGSSVVNNAPIIMIVPSLHGFEKSAAFGTYYYARDLVDNYDKNPVLNSVRTKCILYIIPVGNPYGFDNKIRKNYNGVDLNRNWGTYGGSTDPESPYYMGAEPFDQPETQAIKSVIDATPNMLFLVDYHTDGQYKAASWATVNWMDAPYAILDDRYFRNAYIAAQFHFSEITENLIKEYNLDTNGETIGSITLGSAGSPSGSTIGYYARTQNIMGFTFEGNNGLPSEQAAYSALEQKINSELVGNWVKNLLLVFKDASLQMQNVL